MKNHRTGYYVWLGADRYWHRTLPSARWRIRTSVWASDVTLVRCSDDVEEADWPRVDN